MSKEDLENFVQVRTELHKTYILQKERTKRLGIILSAILILAATVVPIVAPEGREYISYALAACLLVFSAGTAGFTSFSLRSQARRLEMQKPEDA